MKYTMQLTQGEILYEVNGSATYSKDACWGHVDPQNLDCVPSALLPNPTANDYLITNITLDEN